jgi:prolipoprotein diacylglyceryl transferase
MHVLTLSSIPSPGDRSLEVGPLTLRYYGLMIALGVIAAVWLAGKRFRARGYPEETATSMAMWAVPAGLVGARLYHVITDWRRFEGRWGEAFKIWEGGLGVLGGVAAGAVVGVWWLQRHGVDMRTGLDVVAPALPLAQAVGRWGNWFNQELFGRPTDLPWGLEIDPGRRPDRFADEDTFHPTFLYESLWNLGLVAFLLWVDRRQVLGRGRLFALYLAGYSVGRLWIEALRVDPASEVGGLRVNLWIFGLLLVGSLAVALTGARAGTPAAEPPAEPDADLGAEPAVDPAADPAGEDDDALA